MFKKLLNNPVKTTSMMLSVASLVVLAVIIYHKKWSEERVQSQSSFDDIVFLSSQIESNLQYSINSLSDMKRKIILRNYFDIGNERYDFLYDYFKSQFQRTINSRIKQGAMILINEDSEVEISSTDDYIIYEGEVISRKEMVFEGSSIDISLIKSKYNSRTYMSIETAIEEREGKNRALKVVIPFVTSSMSSVLNPDQSIYIMNKDGGVIDFIGSPSAELRDVTSEAIKKIKPSGRMENEITSILDIQSNFKYVITGFIVADNVFVTISSKVSSSPAHNAIVIAGAIVLILCSILIVMGVKVSISFYSDRFNRRISKYLISEEGKRREAFPIEYWYSESQNIAAKGISALISLILKNEREIEYLRKIDNETGIFNSTAYEMEIASLDVKDDEKPTIFRFEVENDESIKRIDYKESQKIVDLISREIKAIEREIWTELQISNFKSFRIGHRLFSFHVMGLSKQDVEIVSSKIHDRLNREVVIDSVVIDLDCHVGIVKSFDLLNDLDVVFWHDFSINALDYARSNNISTVIFDKNIYNHFIRKSSIESDLPGAIMDNQLYLVYEPIYNLKTGKMEILEVSPRWNHMLEGNIGFEEIYDAARKLGFESRLFKWIVTSVFLQVKSWDKEGYRKIKVVIDVDYTIIDSSSIMDFIGDMSSEMSLSLSSFIFSISEIHVSKGTMKVNNHIRKLKQMGAVISVSEVGKGGHFSYNGIINLDPSVMIINGSFLDYFYSNKTCSDVLGSFCQYNKGKGGFVIVKGLSDRNLVPLLNLIGVEFGSGSIFEAPKIAREVVKLFNDRMTLVQ